MYEILLTRRALKDLNNLPKSIQTRIAKKLKEYSTDPLKYARLLVDPKIGMYRYKIGDYRVIFDINNKNKQIIILRIGHRKSIYK